MTQQINLFQPMFRRERQILRARALIQVLALSFLGIAGYVTLDRIRLFQLRTEMTELTARQLASAARFETTNAQIKPKVRSELLASELDHVEAELAASRRAADAIASGTLGNTKGFSSYLAGIAKQHVAGIWITGLAMQSGGTAIGIRGQALDPALVAVFLQQLASEPAFAGKQFSQLRLDRDNQQARSVQFQLSTKPDDTGRRTHGS